SRAAHQALALGAGADRGGRWRMWTEGRGAGGAFVRSWGVGGRGERGVAGRGRRVLVGRSGGPGGAGTDGCAPGGASTDGCRRTARARGARARLLLRVRAQGGRRSALPSGRGAVRRRLELVRRLPGVSGAGALELSRRRGGDAACGRRLRERSGVLPRWGRAR